MTHPEEPAAAGPTADASKDADDVVRKQLMEVLEADEVPAARAEVQNHCIKLC